MITRYYAVKELLENGVNSLPITTEQLEDIITSKGFKIICYDISCKEHAEILDSLGVLQLADRTKAFTYVSKHEKIVFVKIGVSANEKRLLLAHELGHIALCHISDNAAIGYKPSGLIDNGQEDEANAFALEFLAPVCVLSRKRINTQQKISALTLLDEKRSRLVADEIRNHKKFIELESELYRHFQFAEKYKRHERIKQKIFHSFAAWTKKRYPTSQVLKYLNFTISTKGLVYIHYSIPL
ncbi:MAG: ImmA/IrrE family metallo-endopeptidase [Clostridia bacterium]|nr:ImmA/IrrE family metallo-endopeptidase [Clostridia bacterium]